MQLIVPLIVQVALLIGGWKLWRWAKKREKASKTQWRRRFTALFFVSPMVLWVATAVLPENDVLNLLSFLNDLLDAGIAWTIGTVKEGLDEVGGIGVLAVKPVLHSIVYALLGAALGWPLDRMRAKKAEAEGEPQGD